MVTWSLLPFAVNKISLVCLKINRSAKNAVPQASMGVARSGLWAPGIARWDF